MESKKLDVKTKFAIGTALAAFIAGWALTIWGFYLPPRGEVHDSVQWVLGKALIYTASVLGFGMYINKEMAKFRADTRRYLDRTVREEKEVEDEPED